MSGGTRQGFLGLLKLLNNPSAKTVRGIRVSMQFDNPAVRKAKRTDVKANDRQLGAIEVAPRW